MTLPLPTQELEPYMVSPSEGMSCLRTVSPRATPNLDHVGMSGKKSDEH